MTTTPTTPKTDVPEPKPGPTWLPDAWVPYDLFHRKVFTNIKEIVDDRAQAQGIERVTVGFVASHLRMAIWYALQEMVHEKMLPQDANDVKLVERDPQAPKRTEGWYPGKPAPGDPNWSANPGEGSEPINTSGHLETIMPPADPPYDTFPQSKLKIADAARFYAEEVPDDWWSWKRIKANLLLQKEFNRGNTGDPMPPLPDFEEKIFLGSVLGKILRQISVQHPHDWNSQGMIEGQLDDIRKFDPWLWHFTIIGMTQRLITVRPCFGLNSIMFGEQVVLGQISIDEKLRALAEQKIRKMVIASPKLAYIEIRDFAQMVFSSMKVEEAPNAGSGTQPQSPAL